MADRTTEWLPWRAAMQRALYGAGGFYLVERPSAHFRTSVHTSALFAASVSRLLAEVDDAIGTVDPLQVVDLGAGRGELVNALADMVPARVRLVGVDLVPRPTALPSRVQWRRTLPRTVHGVVIANEWLDNVPLDVVEVDSDGRVRVVLVDPSSGEERLGAPVAGAAKRWLDRHWPLDGAASGTRAEIGAPRDAAWARVVRGLTGGVAIAVDYGHRRERRPPLGTLTGFRAGKQVRPVPDGSCDLTAHVALDACADAVLADLGAAVTSSLRSQREVLRGLGVRGDLPSREIALTDPAGYVRRLAAASEAAALTDPDGLGAFGWLSHARGMALPGALGG